MTPLICKSKYVIKNPEEVSSHRSTAAANALLAVLGIFAVVGLKENGKLTAQTTFFLTESKRERENERKIVNEEKKKSWHEWFMLEEFNSLKNVENENVYWRRSEIKMERMNERMEREKEKEGKKKQQAHSTVTLSRKITERTEKHKKEMKTR